MKSLGPFRCNVKVTQECQPLSVKVTTWYPASGCRYVTDGGLRGVGSNGYCWSASPYYNDAYYMNFYYVHVNPSNYYGRAIGYSVRCLQE